MKLPRPFKGLRSPPLEIAGKEKIKVSCKSLFNHLKHLQSWQTQLSKKPLMS